MTRYEEIKADPEKYRKHIENALRWQARNPEKAKESSKRWRQGNGRERINERQRRKYRDNPEHRARMAKYQFESRRDLLGYVRQKVRSWTFLTKSGRIGKASKAIDAMCGKPGHVQSMSGEHVDHVIPLIRFNLCDSVQLRKALHWTNIRGTTAQENMRKGDECQPFDMDELPYADDEEARWQADAFLRYCASRHTGLLRYDEKAG